MDAKTNAEKRWQESSGNFYEKVKVSIFNEDEVRVWKKIINENIPADRALKVLDIGTGPGFFTILLAQEGHDVTGIDCTPGMLDGARKNAKDAGISAQFFLMDCHETSFETDTFDLIISRNVTWTLYDPIKAYTEWKRILKPGGQLLIFDANWYMNFFDGETKQKFDEGLFTYREKFGDFPDGFSMYLIEDYWMKLPLVGIKRPDWDKATLWKLGFTDMKFDCDIDDKVYTQEKGRLLYGSTPMFMISANNPGETVHSHEYLNRYWDSVSTEWSVSCLKDLNSDKKTAYKNLFAPYIKPEMKKVLDIGTGSGFLAGLFADSGFETIGIDMSQEMISQAQYCANALNLNAIFIQANTESLPFENESFDLIVCRNVTWIFQEPHKAFDEWNRVLKKNGRIIYIDANWYLYHHDPNAKKAFEENRYIATSKGLKKLYGNGHSSTELIDRLSADLPFSKISRPSWDRDNLALLGFKIVDIRENITAEICDEIEELRVASTPLFIVCAEKQ